MSTNKIPLQVVDRAGWIAELEEAYREGASDHEVCSILKITYKKFQNYYESNPSFKELVDIGRTLSHAWWLTQGRKNITNGKFNTSLWNFNMKNRFGWADKTESKSLQSEDYDLDSLSTKLRTMLPDILQKLHPDMTQAAVLRKTS